MCFWSKGEFSSCALWSGPDIGERVGTVNGNPDFQEITTVESAFMLNSIVVWCRLTPKQRFLYEEFVQALDNSCPPITIPSHNGVAGTRELATHSQLNALMQLRKVCNHPALFVPETIRSPVVCDQTVGIIAVSAILKHRHHHHCGVRGLVPCCTYGTLSWGVWPSAPCFITEQLWDGVCTARTHNGITELVPKEFIRVSNRHEQPFSQASRSDLLFKSLADIVEGYIPLSKIIFAVPAAISRGPAMIQVVVRSGEAQTQPHCLLPTAPAPLVEFQNMFHPFAVRLKLCFPDKWSFVHTSAKLRILSRILRPLKVRWRKVVVCTQFPAVLDILEMFSSMEFFFYVRIDGSTPTPSYTSKCALFNNNLSVFLCLASTRTCRPPRCNLSAADTIVFYDEDTNPSNDQAVIQCCRPISAATKHHKPLTIMKLRCRNTIEQEANPVYNSDDEVDEEDVDTLMSGQVMDVEDNSLLN
ncbi:hypothetical protein Pelo_9631 [Pelomyxa schiedti]|nr:hypothetical protein Pelo_9631 [Pelomyxa schiedti]